jgi:uncharacterized protein YdeI (YjbR/CyaY-like superfamily)
MRGWLAQHAGSAGEITVGFYKTHTGRHGLTWPQAVDEALCVGWIDGVRRRIDDERYAIRFTPRRQGSVWSAVNITRMEVLQGEGRVSAAGLAVFVRRSEARSRIYSYEQRDEAALCADDERRFRSHKEAWEFFGQQPAGYRKQMVWRIVSAKRSETRAARLEKLIEASARGRRL